MFLRQMRVVNRAKVSKPIGEVSGSFAVARPVDAKDYDGHPSGTWPNTAEAV